MIATKQQRQTRQIELVETYNLHLSLQRLRESGPYDNEKWKRALHHALAMNKIDSATLERVRIALQLP